MNRTKRFLLPTLTAAAAALTGSVVHAQDEDLCADLSVEGCAELLENDDFLNDDLARNDLDNDSPLDASENDYFSDEETSDSSSAVTEETETSFNIVEKMNTSPGSAGEVTAAKALLGGSYLDIFKKILMGHGGYTADGLRVITDNKGIIQSFNPMVSVVPIIDGVQHLAVYQTGRQIKEASYVQNPKVGEKLKIVGSNADAMSTRINSFCNFVRATDTECIDTVILHLSNGIDFSEWKEAALGKRYQIPLIPSQRTALKTAETGRVRYFVAANMVQALPVTTEARTSGRSDIIIDETKDTKICREVKIGKDYIYDQSNMSVHGDVPCENVSLDKFVRSTGSTSVAKGHINQQPLSALYIPHETVLRWTYRLIDAVDVSILDKETKKTIIQIREAKQKQEENQPLHIETELLPVYAGEATQEALKLVVFDPENETWRIGSTNAATYETNDNRAILSIDAGDKASGTSGIIQGILVDAQGLETPFSAKYVLQSKELDEASATISEVTSPSNAHFAFGAGYTHFWGKSPGITNNGLLYIEGRDLLGRLGIGIEGIIGGMAEEKVDLSNQIYTVPRQEQTTSGVPVLLDDSARVMQSVVSSEETRRVFQWGLSLRAPLRATENLYFTPKIGFLLRDIPRSVDGRQTDYNADGVELGHIGLDEINSNDTCSTALVGGDISYGLGSVVLSLGGYATIGGECGKEGGILFSIGGRQHE